MKKFMEEFKTFALRGNVMSLAVGMIVGGAFNEIVTSLTENILSPLIGIFIGQNFDALYWSVFGVTLGYGAFITSVVNFIILAFVVFLMVKTMNKLFEKKEEPAKPQPLCPHCLTVVHPKAVRCGACTSEIGSVL